MRVASIYSSASDEFSCAGFFCVIMKPNFRVLCGILLLCFASARSRNILDGGRVSMDDGDSKESISNEERDLGNNQEGKDTDDLTPFFRSFPLLLDAPVTCEDDTPCKYGEKCEAGVCKCPYEEDEGVCENVKDEDCLEEFSKCKTSKGSCKYNEDRTMRCECGDKKFHPVTKECTATCEEGDCKNGGTCKADTGGTKFCECRDGSNGDFCENVPGCEDKKFDKCKEPNGTCVLGEKVAKCECSGTKKFDDKMTECRATCEEGDCKNGGTCTADTGGTKFCECRDGSNGDFCENVPGCEDKKFDKCKEPNGTCVLGEKVAKCECSGKKKFDDKMNECRATCEEGDCKNGGTCTADTKVSGTKFCKCRDGSNGDLCENVPGCETKKFDKCKEPNGTCVLGEKVAKCECSGTKKFDDKMTECRATCEEGDCKNGGTCTADTGGTKFCECRDGSNGDFCENVPGCEDKKFDKCKEPNGTCVLGEKVAKCECSGKKKFDDKMNECRATCEEGDCKNGGTCTADTKVSGTKFCKCRDGSNGDLCENVPGCETKKFDKCKEPNGTCVLGEKEAKCECSGEKKFDDKMNECRATCENDASCKNGAVCTADDKGTKFCKCKPGSIGDSCDIVPACDSQKFQKCKGDIGDCVFDETDGARCECKGNKKFDGQINDCRATCDDGTNCKNGAVCTDDGKGTKFCKCKPGSSGDTCEIVPACDVAKFQKCKGDVGTCVLDETDGARCECKGDKKFDGGINECRGTCENNENCKNGAVCTDDGKETKFCKCKPGSSGDTCEIVPACDVAKFQKCKGDVGTCVLDETDGARCECKGDKKFDGGINECRGTCDEDKCQNGAKCNEAKFCDCISGFKGDFCEIITSCDNPKFKNCKEGNGTCVVDDVTGARCNCTGDKKFDERINECRGTCENNENCNNGAECTPDSSGVKFCNCKAGTIGDSCDTVTACDKPKFKKCKGDIGTCVFDDTNGARCECKEEKKFDDQINDCRDTCEEGDCKNGGKCTDDGNGKKFCKCEKGSSGDFCKTVAACNAAKFEYCKGDNGTCVLDKSPDGAKCVCKGEKKFDDKINECRDQCSEDEPCDNGGTCEKQFCTCLKGTYGDKCEKVYDCLEGKYKNCSDERGSCAFDKGQKKATCTCEEDKKLDPSLGYCRVVCKDDDCNYKGKCTIPTGAKDKFCNCNKGTTGDSCETVVDCQKEKKFCGDGNDVKCDYNEVKFQAECKCTDKTKGFDGKEKICRKKCEKNEDCQADKEQCTDKLCICKDGLGDEDCTKALGCNETLTKICEAADAKCVYDEGKKEKATCKCSDDEYDEYDENERKCKPKFCMAAKCGAESECVFDKEKGVGICKCKDDEKYYDYKEHKCSVPDPCVLKKTSCKENEECSDGNCKCKKGFKKVNETCVSKMCDNKACLDVGECEPVGDSYTCTCPKGKYFDGSKCADSSCIDKDFKTKCKTCVNGLTWNKDEKKCVPNQGIETCSDECGYGYCIKENDKNTCRCITTVATEKKGKCVLKSSICASGKLTEDSSKCDCKGIYEDAEDKITCQLKTCTEKTQKECQAKRATCVMVKKGGKLNYDCKCQTGYVMDPVLNTCIDACSSQKAIKGCYGKGQQAVCFNSESDLNSETGDCECFPPLTNPNKNCSEIATDVYMIRNIPVLKKEYERNGEIDKVLLNAHLIQSMRQTFVKFKHGYLMDYKLSGNTLDCSIWIEFTEDATSQIKRIQQQVRTFNCTDCDTNLLLWPPHVLIASKDLNVVPEKLEFCSKDSKDKLCGKEALCANNTCSCPKGYTPSYMSRVITETYTIQRCEDIDECSTGTHRCPENTTCVNDLGDYHCKCLPNFKKEKDTVFSRETIDKLKCVDMCTPNPCGKGDCKVKEKGGFDCSCSPGYGGTFCDRADVNFASAKKSAVTVGAILGTLLGVTLIAFFLYYRRVRKNSYSEDFAPASRGGEEMTERRPPMRGMINRSYE